MIALNIYSSLFNLTALLIRWLICFTLLLQHIYTAYINYRVEHFHFVFAMPCCFLLMWLCQELWHTSLPILFYTCFTNIIDTGPWHKMNAKYAEFNFFETPLFLCANRACCLFDSVYSILCTCLVPHNGIRLIVVWFMWWNKGHIRGHRL